MMLLFFLFTKISINVQLDNTYINKKLTVGDPFTIILRLEYPQDYKISDFFVDSLEPFVIIDQKNKITREKGKVINLYKLKLVAFKSGALKIPAFKFLHQDSTTIDTLRSEPIPINITSVLPADMKDINDIKEAVPFPNYLPLLISALVLLAASLLFIGFRIIKKFKKQRAIEQPLPPPWIQALAAIENIPVQEWLAKGAIKKFYYTLSEILKQYLERRFGFNAVEQTTTEIIHNLKQLRIASSDDFRKFFNHADLVKYAKFSPPDEELKGTVKVVRNLIEKTKPEENQKEVRNNEIR